MALAASSTACSVILDPEPTVSSRPVKLAEPRSLLRQISVETISPSVVILVTVYSVFGDILLLWAILLLLLLLLLLCQARHGKIGR